MKIKFKKLNENAKLPTQGSEQAGAWDVYASEIIKESDNYYIVSLGFATEIPKGYRVTASGRSSLTKTNWYIPNADPIIDSDFRGCWQVRFRAIPIAGYSNENEWIDSDVNLIYDDFPFEVGDRVAQIKLEEVLPIEFEEVDELEESVRGEGAWGSTGK